VIVYNIQYKNFNRFMDMNAYYQDARDFSAPALPALALQVPEHCADLRTRTNARHAKLRKRIAKS
jgi:hypothetical protein